MGHPLVESVSVGGYRFDPELLGVDRSAVRDPV
jgi:hypothetical protein